VANDEVNWRRFFDINELAAYWVSEGLEVFPQRLHRIGDLRLVRIVGHGVSVLLSETTAERCLILE
jgi:maltooligosyltrehalose synthase